MKGQSKVTERVWDAFLTERDRQVLAASGYGKKAGFGERPAILVIDVNYAFVGSEPLPILESIKDWPNSCGTEGWDALAVIAALIDAGRARGIPIIYTTGHNPTNKWFYGNWSWKNGRTDEMAIESHSEVVGYDIPREIAPGPRDLIFRKRMPSAFFGTDLASYLTLLKVDSLLVTGTTTSGCVRASVVDAFSHHYRTSVIEDGCFDHSQASHALSLFDMHSKYADVVPSAEALEYLATVPQGMFDLPS
ncbi:MAG: hydrolase [Acetobacteraceae bacterium SCN 69-10]|nr:MAG: hydrolase [Acetobacteraceae bacterium SCN 69-10]